MQPGNEQAEGAEPTPLGECAVVCVDMWGSSSCWPSETGAWVGGVEAVERHNEAVREAFRSAASDLTTDQAFEGPCLGDGRIYVFDADHARRSLTMAGALLEAFPLPALNPGGQKIETSVGLAYGEVLTRSEHGGVQLQGWPIDLAARLSVIAGPGQVVADESMTQVIDAPPQDSPLAERGDMLAAGTLEWTREPVPVRLPAVGDSWNWRFTSAHDIHAQGTSGQPISSRQAKLEQAINASNFCGWVSDSIRAVERRDADGRGYWDRLRDLHRQWGGQDMMQLAETLSEIIGPRSPLTQYLAHFRIPEDEVAALDLPDTVNDVLDRDQYWRSKRWVEGIRPLLTVPVDPRHVAINQPAKRDRAYEELDRDPVVRALVNEIFTGRSALFGAWSALMYSQQDPAPLELSPSDPVRERFQWGLRVAKEAVTSHLNHMRTYLGSSIYNAGAVDDYGGPDRYAPHLPSAGPPVDALDIAYRVVPE